MSETLLLSREDIAEIVSMKDLLVDIEDAFKAVGERRAYMPPKTILGPQAYPNIKMDGYFLGMTAYMSSIEGEAMVGIKWLSHFGTNTQRNLPIINALTVINDTETGLPLAVADGTLITAFRTAAVTAVGAKYLARKDSETVAIIGPGVQGRTHLLALNELFKIRRVNVAARNKAAAMKYAEEMRERTGLDIAVSESGKEAVKEADIVIVATTSETPALCGKWLKKGFFVGSISTREEIDDEVPLRADKIVVDDVEEIMKRSNLKPKMGRGVLSSDDIHGDLSEVVLGRKSGRENDEESILLVTTGMAMEDVTVLFRIYRLAKEKGLGTPFKFL